MKKILGLLLGMTLAGHAANVRFAFTNYVGQADTNWFQVIPVGDVIQADGSFITRGVPIRLTPAIDGKITNTFELGNYNVTNKFLARGFLIRVPNDHGPTIYDATSPTNLGGLAISGYNTFVTITYGTNPPPTYDEITNSLGFLPERKGVALTNNETRSVQLNGSLSVSNLIYGYDVLTLYDKLIMPGMLLDYSTANSGVFYAPDGTLFRSRNASILTNILQSSVVGLSNALAYLTNNQAVPITLTNNQIALTNLSNQAGLSFTTVPGAKFIFSADVEADSFAASLFSGATFIGDNFHGQIDSGDVTNSAGSRVAYLSDITGGGGGAATNAIGNTNGVGYGVTTLQQVVATNYTGDGSSLTNITTYLWVRTNGNNSTALRGRSTLPFATIDAAANAAHKGDFILVGPGNYKQTNIVNIPDNGGLIAIDGPASTWVTNWNYAVSAINGVTFHPGTNSITKGFSFWDAMRGSSSNINYAATWGAYANGGQPGFVNAILEDCCVYGSSDGIYVQQSNTCSLTLRNCHLDSDWDNIMIKAEPGASTYVSHSIIIENCIITGTHGGGWTNHATYGIGLQSYGLRAHIVNTSVRMTNTTFAGSATTIGCDLPPADVTATVIGGEFYSSTRSAYFAGWTGPDDNKYIYTYGVNIPPETQATQTGLVMNQGSLSAASLYGISLPTFTTNYGGIIYLNSSNQWSLTRSNYGAAGILHRGGTLATTNGYGYVGLPPYFGPVDLAGEVTGVMQTSRLDWQNSVGANNIPVVNNGETDVQPLTIGNGLVLQSSTLSVGTNGSYLTNLAAGNISSGTLSYLRAGSLTNHTDVTITSLSGSDGLFYNSATGKWTNGPASGGGGGGSDGRGWDTNGNSALPADSFVGTTDNYDLELRSSNTAFVRISGYSNTVIIGKSNFISGWQPYSVIGGGRANTVSGATNSAFNYALGYNTIAGGATNSIKGSFVGGNTIGGGRFNVIDDEGWDVNTIGGGHGNINSNSAFGTIAGGHSNREIDYANYSAIGGGFSNRIVGGTPTSANEASTIGGGELNTVSAPFATIPGGNQNTASGSNSVAIGFKASATHAGSVVVSADVSSNTGQASTANNSFTLNASGGINLLGSSIVGNGAGLTNLNASSLASGTVADARSAKALTNFTALSSLRVVSTNGVDAGTPFVYTEITNRYIRGNAVLAGDPPVQGDSPGAEGFISWATGEDATMRIDAGENNGMAFRTDNAMYFTADTGFFFIGAGVVTANGGNITNLNASSLASGTVPDARLSANVALLNRNQQAFTGTNWFREIGVTNLNQGTGIAPLGVDSTGLLTSNAVDATIITGGSGAALAQLASGSVAYMPFGVYGAAPAINLTTQRWRIPYNCTLSDFWISYDTGLGTGTNQTIRLYTNGVYANYSLVAAGQGTSTAFAASNTTSTLVVQAGTYVHVQYSNDCPSAPATQLMNWAMRATR